MSNKAEIAYENAKLSGFEFAALNGKAILMVRFNTITGEGRYDPEYMTITKSGKKYFNKAKYDELDTA